MIPAIRVLIEELESLLEGEFSASYNIEGRGTLEWDGAALTYEGNPIREMDFHSFTKVAPYLPALCNSIKEVAEVNRYLLHAISIMENS